MIFVQFQSYDYRRYIYCFIAITFIGCVSDTSNVMYVL